MKKTIIILSLIFTSISYSQDLREYSWDEKPVFKEIPAEYKDQPAVVLLDKREFYPTSAFDAFAINHLAVKINKAEEINKYNKVKAEGNGKGVIMVRDFHARVIKPNGTINVISEDKIVETDISKEKWIVFEGVETGDIIEYYFIIKEKPTAFNLEIFQREIPVLEAYLLLKKNAVFAKAFASPEFKYNKDPNIYIATAENIPPFVKEMNATNSKNLVKIFYHLFTKYPSPYEWAKVIAKRNKAKFKYFSSSTADKFISNLNIDKNATTDQKIQTIDNYIKDNFTIVADGEQPNKISNLTDTKQKLSSEDINSIYILFLKKYKIDFNVGAGVSRFMGELYEYDFSQLLSEHLIFIPETKKYIYPYDNYYTYGNPMPELQSSTGVISAKYKHYVLNHNFPIITADFTTTDTQSEVSLSEDLEQAFFEKTSSYTGYSGLYNRGYIKYYKENNTEKEFTAYIQNLTLSGIDAKLKDYKIENQELKNNYTNTPCKVTVKAEAAESMVENSGKRIIVNLGKIIGKQTDLYQEKTRRYDIDLQYAKTYKHKITFNIPKGYTVEKSDDLVIEAKMAGDENENCSFKSTVKVEGNKVIVEVYEVYKSIHYPVDKYFEYRKVINACSDFTKASLILKKS